MKNKRFEEIDLIKALGIILIVAGHAGFPYSPFINFFHVALFFIASGYVYKTGHATDIRTLMRFIWRKIRFLCFPYYLYNTILSLLHNPLIGIGFYSLRSSVASGIDSTLALTDRWGIREIMINILKGLLFRADNELIQGIWFIKDLFIISIIYCFIDYLLHGLKTGRKHIQTFLSAVFLLLGFYLDRKGLIPYSMARILTCYSLYHLGSILKEKKEVLHFADIRIRAAAFVLPLILFVFLQLKGFSVSLVKNRYPDPLFLLLVSFAGWLLCYETARMITRTGRLKNILLYLGRNSYVVLLLHIICFKPVSLLKLHVTGSPLYCLSCIPTYQGEEKGWWLIYAAAGILLPLLYCILKDRVFKKNQKGI